MTANEVAGVKVIVAEEASLFAPKAKPKAVQTEATAI
jgi:hypothetical protein